MELVSFVYKAILIRPRKGLRIYLSERSFEVHARHQWLQRLVQHVIEGMTGLPQPARGNKRKGLWSLSVFA